MILKTRLEQIQVLWVMKFFAQVGYLCLNENMQERWRSRGEVDEVQEFKALKYTQNISLPQA